MSTFVSMFSYTDLILTLLFAKINTSPNDEITVPLTDR